MIEYPGLSFESIGKCANTKARRGVISTPHGDIQTPAFIFCGTKAAIKGVTPKQMRDANTQIILSNTYHLMLQPGADKVEALGGLQKMTGWNGPMLTDSGGFQIFSLGHGGSVCGEIKGSRASPQPQNRAQMKISEEGVAFKSYVDGSKFYLTPETAMQVQRQLGADLVVALDECTPMHSDKGYTAKSMRMSMRWELRSLKELAKIQADLGDRPAQGIYSISQGGVYPDLRRECADFMNEHPFFAHAIGGSWGNTKSQMYEILGAAMEPLRRDRPIHILGCGGLDDIFEGVALGADTFDCVHPTRIARHGVAYAHGETNHRLNLLNSRFKTDDSPLSDPSDANHVPSEVAHFSKGYIHHLFKAKELLGMQILAIHNVAFMNKLMQDIRDAIAEDRYPAFRRAWEGYLVDTEKVA